MNFPPLTAFARCWTLAGHRSAALRLHRRRRLCHRLMHCLLPSHLLGRERSHQASRQHHRQHQLRVLAGARHPTLLQSRQRRTGQLAQVPVPCRQQAPTRPCRCLRQRLPHHRQCGHRCSGGDLLRLSSRLPWHRPLLRSHKPPRLLRRHCRLLPRLLLHQQPQCLYLPAPSAGLRGQSCRYCRWEGCRQANL